MSQNANSLILLEDPDLTVGQMMELWPQTIAVFLRHHMRCIGCPVRRFYTVTEACRIYGLSRADFMDEVRVAIA